MNNPRRVALLVLALTLGSRASAFDALFKPAPTATLEAPSARNIELRPTLVSIGPGVFQLQDPSLGIAPAATNIDALIPAQSAMNVTSLLERPQATNTAALLAGSGATMTSDAVVKDASRGYSAGEHAFDGLKLSADLESGDGGRTLEPSFEPPSFKAPPPGGGDGGGKGGNGGNGGNNGGSDEGGGEIPRRPALSFANAATKSALLSVDPAKSIYGAVKRLRGQGSKDYWGVYKKGTEIDVVIRGESVFGRPTTVTEAFNKPIGKLTRDDLKGTVMDYQLKAPIKQLRQMFITRLEEDRKQWHENDEPVNLKTLVRVVKFKSYLDLYRDTHGADATPEPEAPKVREPLTVKPEGRLARLATFAPRAVFLDMDLLEGPISKEVLSDMAELQRTGVYFVAFSRKPYAAAASLREKLIRQMSSYQLSILMPIRFMAVTDNGAVISEFPKGGNVIPVDVLSFSPMNMEVMRDAAQKASEEAGIPPKSVSELAQPGIREAADQFPGLTRRESHQSDPRVRFELSFPKGTAKGTVHEWLLSFGRRLESQGLKVKTSLDEQADGGFRVSVQRTDLGGSLDRLKDALGKKFGLYLNPSDILVLSNDPQLKAANPDLDFGKLSGLNGEKMVDNALGLILGEAREKGFLSGSASRISSFRRDRHQYMSEILIAQDKAEQNINFFSGHVVHSANDWLVHQLQNGKRPTEKEYSAELQRRWDEGTREFKAVGMPEGETVDGMLRESNQRGLSMYKMIVAAADRKEILVGTEIPNFFMLKDFQRRTENLKNKYLLHTIFDFIALRPDPKNPGHATVVIYDFKTGPAQSRQKLDKDIQVQIYTYFARQKWVGRDFPAPYLSGDKAYKIDNVAVEFIYNAVKQPTTVTTWDLAKTRATIIRALNGIKKTEQLALGEIEPKAKNVKKGSAKKKKPAKKTASAKTASSAKAAAPKKKST